MRPWGNPVQFLLCLYWRNGPFRLWTEAVSERVQFWLVRIEEMVHFGFESELPGKIMKNRRQSPLGGVHWSPHFSKIIKNTRKRPLGGVHWSPHFSFEMPWPMDTSEWSFSSVFDDFACSWGSGSCFWAEMHNIYLTSWAKDTSDLGEASIIVGFSSWDHEETPCSSFFGSIEEMVHFGLGRELSANASISAWFVLKEWFISA